MNYDDQMGLFEPHVPRKTHACSGSLCLTCGLDAKEKGQTRALVNKSEWAEAAAKWVRNQPNGAIITSENITQAIGLPSGGVGQHKNNSVGASMTAMSKLGLIRHMGYQKSKIKHSHGAVLSIWEVTGGLRQESA
jgi:hypothetical protein